MTETRTPGEPAGPGAEADAMHEALHGLMARAGAALAREDATALAGHLRSLLQATMAHFEWEDRLMTESAFPEAAAHRQAHTDYLVEFRKMNQEVERSGLSPMFRLWFTTRFQDWMRFHTRGSDGQLLRHWTRHQEAQAGAQAGAQAAAPAGAPAAAPAGKGPPAP